MSGYEIATIVLAVCTAIAGVSWATVKVRAKRIKNNGLKLKAQYQQAIADGTITDEERLQIADTAIAIIDDALSLLQTLQNLVMSVVGLFRRK